MVLKIVQGGNLGENSLSKWGRILFTLGLESFLPFETVNKVENYMNKVGKVYEQSTSIVYVCATIATVALSAYHLVFLSTKKQDWRLSLKIGKS